MTAHSAALKLEKSVKKRYLHFQKWQKNQFLQQKKSLKLPKMQFRTDKNRIFGNCKLFSVAKIDFFASFEMAKNVFLYFGNCTLFTILEHCVPIYLTYFLQLYHQQI